MGIHNGKFLVVIIYNIYISQNHSMDEVGKDF